MFHKNNTLKLSFPMQKEKLKINKFLGIQPNGLAFRLLRKRAKKSSKHLIPQIARFWRLNFEVKRWVFSTLPNKVTRLWILLA
jgi:hypothetical protein